MGPVGSKLIELAASVRAVCGAEDSLSKTSTVSGLAAELNRRATSQSRLIGAAERPYLADRSSPFTRRIYDAWTNKLVGPRTTYVIYASSNSGKSAAIRDFISNRLENSNRKSLYINCEDSIDIVVALQNVLNTTCDSGEIAKAFVSGLGSAEAGGRVAQKPAYLIIDEVNVLEEGAGSTKTFIQSLFQKVAEAYIVCIIVCNQKNTADKLVGLNGGKIVPHPSFLREGTQYDAEARQPITWDENIGWTDAELEALLDFHFPLVTSIDRTTFIQGLPQNQRKPGNVIAEYITAFSPP